MTAFTQLAQAPHPALQNALFVYAAGSDGACAELIRGWPALVGRVVNDVAGGPWEELLSDLYDWNNDGDGVPFKYSVTFEDGYMAIYRISEALAAAQAVAEPVAEPAGWRDALQFYANRRHFVLAEEDAWDTVSGEPANFWCDEAGTATVEDGAVAAMALRGTPLRDEDEGATSPPAQTPAEVAPPQALRIALEDLDSREAIGPTTEAVIDAAQKWYLATPTQPLPTAAAIEPACSPTLTECPRCKNELGRCDGVFATHPAPVLANGLTEAALTDERIDAMWKDATSPKMGHIGYMATYLAARQLARAVEAAIRTEGK